MTSTASRPLAIAILGTRGVPASYGGFETFAEELGARLAERGHAVTVYARRRHVPAGLESHRGIRLRVVPTIQHKYLETVVHTAVSAVHAIGGHFDAVIMCNAANALFSAIPRLAGTRVILNVDGIERKRRKWNALGRAWYLASERLATWLPDVVVTDARVIERYYRDRYGANTTFIPYGADLVPAVTREVLDRLGVEPRAYVLYVSRLEPENNALAVIEGYKASGIGVPLVLVGDAPYAREYIASLRQAAVAGVIMPGAIYGQGYRELQSHALAYVHATEVGGTHPALVEAMGAGNCVIVHDEPANREVAGDAALYFDASRPETLAARLREVVNDPALRAERGRRGAERAAGLFSWDAVTDAYESLCARLVARTASPAG